MNNAKAKLDNSIKAQSKNLLDPIKHLLTNYHETFYKSIIGEMPIDGTLARVWVQGLQIVGWIITKEEHLIKINLGILDIRNIWRSTWHWNLNNLEC